MKKFSNTEAEMKKSVAYKKSVHLSGAQPDIFRAGEVSWNKATSINIWSKSQEKSFFSLLDTLKTAFWMANLA